jgi:hypothetical protein
VSNGKAPRISKRVRKLCDLRRPLIVLVTLWAAASAASTVPLTASVDDHQTLPSLSVGGVQAMSSRYDFWQKNWGWAGLRLESRVVAPFEYVVSGTNRKLNFELYGHVTKSSDRQLVWDFDLNALQTTSGVIGGGISFKFDLARFGSQFGEPDLLPADRGWRWGRPGGAQVEMRFDPPMATVYFERGNKSAVRAFFFKDIIPQGHKHIVATLTVSGNATIVPTLAERFGISNGTSWPANILDWERAPVDLSFLNRSEMPAGKHGFLKTVGNKLVFEDGTPARFWGTNLVAYSLFRSNRNDVKEQAQRLSQLGFNLVRLHHVDSDWVHPNIFGNKAVNTRKLDEASLEKLDWWIKCLKDEGIYIWLDLDDGRRLTAGDGIEGYDEIRKGKQSADLRGYNYVNPSIQAAMQRFNEAYLNHVNRFNGLRYKDDPAIVAILITNENDLTNHFGNALLPDKKVPWHDSLYMKQAAAFAEKTRLPKAKTWRSWEPGPSKFFLNDLEHQFNAKMIGQLRTLGVKVPIVTTDTWGRNPLFSLPALTDGNIIDVHSYGGVEEISKNPLYGANLIDWIAAGQIVGRPLSVSEWNVSPFPVPDRHTIPLYVAGVASLQGWDALMQFAYSQQPLNGPGKAGNWDAFNDPSLIATLPAAALLYRRHDAQEGRTTYVFAPTPGQLFEQTPSADNSVALRTAAEKGKLMIALPKVRELPWLTASHIPKDAKIIIDPQMTLIANNADEVVSDTGELTRNWQQGIYKIDTPRTQAAMGWIGGKNIELKDVVLDISTRNATVAVQSLDNSPIKMAGSLMISLGARSIPTYPKVGWKGVFRSEPVVGHLTIRAKPGLKLYKRVGSTLSLVPISYANGRYRIELAPNLDTYWLFMK